MAHILWDRTVSIKDPDCCLQRAAPDFSQMLWVMVLCVLHSAFFLFFAQPQTPPDVGSCLFFCHPLQAVSELTLPRNLDYQYLQIVHGHSKNLMAKGIKILWYFFPTTYFSWSFLRPFVYVNLKHSYSQNNPLILFLWTLWSTHVFTSIYSIPS